MESTSENSRINENNIAMFTSSESFYRHPLSRNVLFTEGCAFLAENGAAWLVDAIAIAQNIATVQDEPFQSWKLTVDNNDRTALLAATDGGADEDEDGRPVYKEIFFQKIPYTDFPLSQIRLYCCSNGLGETGKTIMLTSEY